MFLLLFLLVPTCFSLGGKGTNAPDAPATSSFIKSTISTSSVTVAPAICTEPVGACLFDQCPGEYECRDGSCYPLCCDLGDFCQAWKQNGFCENEYTKNDVAKFCSRTCGLCK